MQSTSTQWRQQWRETLVPETFVEVTLLVSDPDIDNATATDNGHVHFSNTAQIANRQAKDPPVYATVERNLWVLDGSRRPLPPAAPFGDNGYIGMALCDNNSNFTSIPVVTLTFPAVVTTLLPGITITWSTAYDEYAVSYRVRAYNGGALVATFTETDNDLVESPAPVDLRNFDRITIEVMKWSVPGRRPRIADIFVGLKKVYTKRDLMNYSHVQSVDPLSAELPNAEIQFEILNLNGEYNPDNPEGAEKYLMQRQMVKSRYGLKLGDNIEWIDGGTFYISGWDTPQNGITASFTARDLLEYMTDLYTGPSTGTLYDIALAALQQADLPITDDGGNRWALDDGLVGITAPANVSLAEHTMAEVLQLCANAACMVMYQDRQGILHIEPMADGVTDYLIDQYNSYEYGEIELTKQLKAVDVNGGEAVAQGEGVGETQKIENPLISADRAQIVADWARDYLINRKILSGTYRSDPRLDALDRITTQNKYAKSELLITQIEYTYGGAFRGSYEGRGDV